MIDLVELVYTLIAINAILQVADVITTNGALRNGAVEANPIILRVMGVIGSLWWIPKLLVAFGALYAAYLYPTPSVAVGLAAVALWYMKIVYQNYKLWKR